MKYHATHGKQSIRLPSILRPCHTARSLTNPLYSKPNGISIFECHEYQHPHMQWSPHRNPLRTLHARPKIHPHRDLRRRLRPQLHKLRRTRGLHPSPLPHGRKQMPTVRQAGAPHRQHHPHHPHRLSRGQIRMRAVLRPRLETQRGPDGARAGFGSEGSFVGVLHCAGVDGVPCSFGAAGSAPGGC